MFVTKGMRGGGSKTGKIVSCNYFILPSSPQTLKPACLFEIPFAHIDSACLLNSLNFKYSIDFEVSQRPKLSFTTLRFLFERVDHFLTLIIYFWIRVVGTSSRIQIKKEYQ